MVLAARRLATKLMSDRERYLEGQSPIEPLFEQGHYRDRSNGYSANSDISDFLAPLDGLSRTVGIPLLLKGGIVVNVLASHAETIALYGGTGVGLWDCTCWQFAPPGARIPRQLKVCSRASELPV